MNMNSQITNTLFLNILYDLLDYRLFLVNHWTGRELAFVPDLKIETRAFKMPDVPTLR